MIIIQQLLLLLITTTTSAETRHLTESTLAVGQAILDKLDAPMTCGD